MTCVLLTVSTWYKQTVHHTYIYKLEIITKCVVSALTPNVEIVHCALWGYEFICLDIKCNTFCIKCTALEYSIFIVTNWLSYTLLFSAIGITSLLCYWYNISNFCQILGTNSLQKSLFEKWGDIVTQYIAVLVHHSSLIEQTHEKVVLCNTMSLSENCQSMVMRGAVIYFHFHSSCSIFFHYRCWVCRYCR